MRSYLRGADRDQPAFACGCLQIEPTTPLSANAPASGFAQTPSRKALSSHAAPRAESAALTARRAISSTSLLTQRAWHAQVIPLPPNSKRACTTLKTATCAASTGARRSTKGCASTSASTMGRTLSALASARSDVTPWRTRRRIASMARMRSTASARAVGGRLRQHGSAHRG